MEVALNGRSLRFRPGDYPQNIRRVLLDFKLRHYRNFDQLDIGAEDQGGKGITDVFAFLTTEPNTIVALIHPKAMLVILTTDDEFDVWLRAPANEAMALQRPLTDGLMIVAKGARQDGVVE